MVGGGWRGGCLGSLIVTVLRKKGRGSLAMVNFGNWEGFKSQENSVLVGPAAFQKPPQNNGIKLT